MYIKTYIIQQFIIYASISYILGQIDAVIGNYNVEQYNSHGY